MKIVHLIKGGYTMSTGEYEIGASIPVQVGNGKMEKGKDNTEITAENSKSRNKEYGALEIQIAKNSEKELRAYLAKYDPEKLKEYESKKAREASDEVR